MNTSATALPNTLAIDPAAVGQLRSMALKKDDAGARVVAQQFESLMLQQMLSSMREASPEYSSEDNHSMEIFRNMQDKQMAQGWASKGGLGLADIIVKQIQVQQNPALLNIPKQVPVRGAGILQQQAAQPALPADGAAKTAAGGFLQKIAGVASDTARQLGVPPQALMAHAALETGWGKRNIRDAAGNDSHNLFGIKAGSNWKGKTVDVTTTEYIGGVAQKKVETFRAYDSYSEAFADYANVLKQRFGSALQAGASSISGFGQALAASGYATDPNYAQKFSEVAQSVASRLNDSRIGS